MIPFRVILEARTIQVTAKSEEQAVQYANEDALEFMNAWELEYRGAETIDEAEHDDERIELDELELVHAPRSRHADSVWTFDASFCCDVLAANENEARDKALELIKAA